MYEDADTASMCTVEYFHFGKEKKKFLMQLALSGIVTYDKVKVIFITLVCTSM